MLLKPISQQLQNHPNRNKTMVADADADADADDGADADAEVVQMTFCVGGLIDPEQHFYVEREREIMKIAHSVESDYVLLHAHRWAGKSSIIEPIECALTEKFPTSVIVSVNFEGLEEINFWESLWRRMSAACEESILTKFRSLDDFLVAFSSNNFIGQRVYLIIDGIDQLLKLPGCCESFLSALRVIKTTNTSNEATPYAIHGMLGLGTHHVTKLSNFTGVCSPPFNVAQLIRLPQPQLHEVVQMFSKYGAMINRDITAYAEDIFGRTGGHLGLVSFFGGMLQKWIDSPPPFNSPNTIEGWLRYVHSSKETKIDRSPFVHSILLSLLKKGDHMFISRQILFCLMTNSESIRDPSQQSTLHNDAVDYLEVIGAVVRVIDDRIRFSAPLLRIVFFDYFLKSMEKVSVLPDLVFPLIRIGDSSRCRYDMTGCIHQAIALFDREPPHRLQLFSVDIVRAFHYQLHCIMCRMVVSSRKWTTESEVWNASGKNGLRMDVFFTEKVARFRKKLGFEILATDDIMDLQDYLTNQATLYKQAAYLDVMLIVIVLSELPQSRDNFFFTTSARNLSIIYVHIPLLGPVSTILQSKYIEDDITVDMLKTVKCGQSVQRVDNVIVEKSIVKLDQPMNIAVVVGDTLFEETSYPRVSDFLTGVKNEVVSNMDADDRLRLYSKKRKLYVAASTETKTAFSEFQVDDLEIRCGNRIFPLTKH